MKASCTGLRCTLGSQWPPTTQCCHPPSSTTAPPRSRQLCFQGRFTFHVRHESHSAVFPASLHLKAFICIMNIIQVAVAAHITLLPPACLYHCTSPLAAAVFPVSLHLSQVSRIIESLRSRWLPTSHCRHPPSSTTAPPRQWQLLAGSFEAPYHLYRQRT